MNGTAVEPLAVASLGVPGIAADDVGLVEWPDSPQPTHNTTGTRPLAASGACIRDLLAVRVSVAHRRFSGTFNRLALPTVSLLTGNQLASKLESGASSSVGPSRDTTRARELMQTRVRAGELTVEDRGISAVAGAILNAAKPVAGLRCTGNSEALVSC
jgi:hypothetical protein